MSLKHIDQHRKEFETDKQNMGAEDLKLKYLSQKSGILHQLSKLIKEADDKRVFGAEFNKFKQHVSESIAALRTATRSRVGNVGVDFTRPSYLPENGTIHPVEIMIGDAINIFAGMGFRIVDDTELDSVKYCFDRLRTPQWHPARDKQDTFYLEGSDEIMLRTHATSTQAKILEVEKPPIKVLSVGRVYRSDAIDATHTPMFHQVDGFMVDKNINLGHLKGVLGEFIRRFVPSAKTIRFRPHYFGYTEPSFEVDVECTICGGQGCKSCKYNGWIEVLGAGMMHPELFENVGLDPNEYSGFAFGLGVERLVMQKYGIEDIRYLYNNDLRLLSQIKK